MDYEDPLVNRYVSKEILSIFSNQNRYTTWRKLWIALAKGQKQLGLPISHEQIIAMEKALPNINFAEVAELEKELKHDVMAHLHHFAAQVPLAKPIMHLGATSEYIKDNTDLILIKNALELIDNKMKNLITIMKDFSLKYKEVATVGYTHYQTAQPTTVGRRACDWLQAIIIDYKEIKHFYNNLKFRGIKGTTGTLASFKNLFNNNYSTVQELNSYITNYFGFKDYFIITGQTYPRKLDVILLNTLANFGDSACKITNDLRLLQNLKELSEQFTENQVGSSAMPYKQNPIKCERASSLAKYLITLPVSGHIVASTQWLERTLDDSANRRITLPNAFFTFDAIIELLIDIFTNLQVNKKVIEKNINYELPFLATENILMEAVKQGGDRQLLHEKLRQYSIKVRKDMIEKNDKNHLLDLILEDKDFMLNQQKLDNIMNTNNFIGFSLEQIQDFINQEVNPILGT